MIRRCAGGLLLVVCVGLGASCATIHTRTTQYAGAPHQPPGDASSVGILRADPTKPYDELGEVRLEVSVSPAPPVAEIEARLRQAAAKIGADAVLVREDTIQPVGAYESGPWWGRTVNTVEARKIVGVAIKYR